MRATGTLVLMGSGETTPTMVTTHKALLAAQRARGGPGALRASLLDTPYGFQENAAEITGKAIQYFGHNIGQAVEHVPAGRVEGAPGVQVEQALDAVRRSDWVFAGPGSPTYAQRQWAAAPFVDALAEVCNRGGTVVLASAAAVTAGERTVPVYEIYKAGAPPAWADGMGLLRRLTGWQAVVVPHFDNAEGGTHDTRFCYLGGRRLAAMEADLPAGTWILGVDEHTACVLDLAAGTLRVEGRGGVHVRRDGVVVADLAAGTTSPMADVEAAATGRIASTGTAPAAAAPQPSSGARNTPATTPIATLEEQLQDLHGRFGAALDADDADAATAAALDTEQAIRDWAADTLDADVSDRAVAQLRAMLTRLGDLAAAGMHDHRDLVRPHIETLLHVREDARTRKAFEVADHIRVHMDADGVRVEDTREGTRWDWDEPAR